MYAYEKVYRSKIEHLYSFIVFVNQQGVQNLRILSKICEILYEHEYKHEWVYFSKKTVYMNRVGLKNSSHTPASIS